MRLVERICRWGGHDVQLRSGTADLVAHVSEK